MKTLLSILFLASVALTACHKKCDDSTNQNPGGNCKVTDNIRARYTESAYHMMMRAYMADTAGAPYHQAELSTTERDRLLRLIQAVYNTASPERDTVFNIYNIAEYPTVSLHDVTLQVDMSAPEVKNLAAGKPSGNATFDALLTKYGIDSVRGPFISPSGNYLFARTEVPHNMIQIAKELEAFRFIYNADPEGSIGDGDRIKLNTFDCFAVPCPTEIDFSIGRGDCPAGCTERRHWVFHVFDDCTVQFVRSYDGQ
jgi:hypothetical protein